MYAKRIRVKYYIGLSDDIRKWRRQGFKGEIIIC